MSRSFAIFQRPAPFALMSGSVLCGLWLVAVSLLTRDSLQGQWVFASFLSLGLLPAAMVALCGYLVLEARQALLRNQRKAVRPGGRYYELFTTVRRVTRIMGAQNKIQAVLNDITRSCLEAFTCTQVSLMLLDDRNEELVVCSAAGAIKEAVIGHKQSIGDGIAGKVAKELEPLILGEDIDASQFCSFEKKTLPISASMVIPILLREDLVGVLNITSRVGGHRYSEDDLEAALIFAEITAVCIRHAQQTNWMRETIQRLSGTGPFRPHSARAGG